MLMSAYVIQRTPVLYGKALESEDGSLTLIR
jgi:hypothetical protein